MADWKQEYIDDILNAEKQRNADRELIVAYSQLVDRVSFLEAENAALRAQLQAGAEPATAAKPSASSGKKPFAAPATSLDPPPAADDDTAQLIARLRVDLAEALRSQTQFQQRLQAAEDELGRLRARTSADARALRELTAEKKLLTTKLRDREEELRVKSKLVADVQDELAVLNMQLDVVERKRAEKEAENRQLVERYMRRVDQEVEALNMANEPLFKSKKR
ncbi:hypothetical protein VTJ83DRAFT_867 [Remersonia thermophila]|uniref:Autophagy-related protein 16 domain-containing protein n=1 Tax=Remersonia thermophila TaxID=72144 RepID=A0ABR4DMR0_9PEZI